MSQAADGRSSRGRRVLSAIMFTDVVGFSARMGQNETLTGALVQRDLEFMTRRCEARRGRVVKTTGDGLLVVFDSAVEAVSAAIAIQQAIADAGKRLPKEQVLQHRIAVHLGDIIVTADNDVMGEGVNIAARLQELAEPGGVCISAATYELVKNRLKLEGVYVGPCELKNISEPVGVYRLGVGGKPGAKSSGGGVSPAVGRRWALDRRWWWRGGVAAALVAVLVTLGVMLGGDDAAAERANREPTQVAAMSAAPQPVVAEPAPSAEAPSIVDALPADADFFVARLHFVRRNDFTGLVNYLLAHPELVPEASKRQEVIERYTRMAAAQVNLMLRLKEHSSDAPLKIVDNDGDASDDWEVWADESERLHVRQPDGERSFALDEMPNMRIFQIAVTIVANDTKKSGKRPSAAMADLLKALMKDYGISESELAELMPPGVRTPK